MINPGEILAARTLIVDDNQANVARFGGDEFVVLLDGLSLQPGEAATQTAAIAQKMLGALGRTYQLGTHAYDTSLSMGVVIFLGELEATGDLLKKADLAMYQAKGAGRHPVRFFDPAVPVHGQVHGTLA